MTYVCILKACAMIRVADKGKQIHDKIARQGNNILLGGALVDMYAKCSVVMCQSLGHGHVARSGAPVVSAKFTGNSPNFWRFSQQPEEAKIAFLLIYELWICWIWPTGPLRNYKYVV